MSQVFRLQSANGHIVETDDEKIAVVIKTTVPADGLIGYIPGAIAIVRGGSGDTSLYANRGSLTSSSFKPLVNGLPLAGGTLTDGANIAVGSTTGTQIGTAVTQKLGFFGAAPVVEPAGASQAAVTQTQTALTDSTGGTPTTTLAAITAGAGYAQADAVAMKNAIASLAAELALVKTDVANTITLDNALRTALVNLGLVKGAA